MRKKPKTIRDKLKNKIIRDIWTIFKTEEEKKWKKEIREKERTKWKIKDTFEARQDTFGARIKSLWSL